MILKDDIIVIILKSNTGNNTIVNIYDIQNREKPILLKEYTMYEPYYTSRCINNKLYVISSGKLKKENGKIERTYEEDSITREIKLEDIKYLTDINTNKQTLISFVDLNNITNNVEINSYLIDVSNAYVSEENIYLLNKEYESLNETPPISSIFGLEGAYGAKKWEEENDVDNGSYYYTDIYKFQMKGNQNESHLSYIR